MRFDGCDVRDMSGRAPRGRNDDPAMNASLVYLLLQQIMHLLTQLARDGGAVVTPGR
jgi:hypothetical protein